MLHVRVRVGLPNPAQAGMPVTTVASTHATLHATCRRKYFAAYHNTKQRKLVHRSISTTACQHTRSHPQFATPEMVEITTSHTQSRKQVRLSAVDSPNKKRSLLTGKKHANTSASRSVTGGATIARVQTRTTSDTSNAHTPHLDALTRAPRCERYNHVSTLAHSSFGQATRLEAESVTANQATRRQSCGCS